MKNTFILFMSFISVFSSKYISEKTNLLKAAATW